MVGGVALGFEEVIDLEEVFLIQSLKPDLEYLEVASIGEATANKMKEHRLVTWTNHGIYGAGNDIDEAFGLIKTVEKTAQIYMMTLGHVVNEIPDEVIIGLAKLWNLEMMPGVIEEK